MLHLFVFIDQSSNQITHKSLFNQSRTHLGRMSSSMPQSSACVQVQFIKVLCDGVASSYAAMYQENVFVVPRAHERTVSAATDTIHFHQPCFTLSKFAPLPSQSRDHCIYLWKEPATSTPGSATNSQEVKCIRYHCNHTENIHHFTNKVPLHTSNGAIPH